MTTCQASCPAGKVGDSALGDCVTDPVTAGPKLFYQATFTDANVNALGVVTFLPSAPSTLTSLCNGVQVFGVEGTFGGGALKVSINFAGLPARDSVRVTFGLYALGTWTAAD